MMGAVISRITRVLPDLILLAMALGAQIAGARWWWRRVQHPAGRRAIQTGLAISLAAILFGFLMRFERVIRVIPWNWAIWERGLAIVWILLTLGWMAGFALLRWVSRTWAVEHHPGRRHFLSAVRAVLFAAPPAVLGYGMFIERSRLQLREQNLQIPDLPPDLDGVRLVQLTDIHMGAFLSRKDLERAVAMANETRAQVALVTGDLITTVRDPLDDCLDALAGLRADAGIFGCLGNHEVFTGTENYVEREGARRGLRFLRQATAPLRFGNTTLNLAGVDYQRVHDRYLRGAEKLLLPGAFNLLLSHNPDVFRVAARQGYPLTISGHTHGGQVRVEILHTDVLDVARFYTPYVDGFYQRGAASLFVSRGIGTIGIPARIGAPPEVALLRLCRA
jgi:hypothetical protein